MRHKKKRYGFGLSKDGTGKSAMAPGARRMKRMSKRKMRSRA